MPHSTSPFPSTQGDIARLKQTAIDAVNDLGGTAAVHGTKTKGQINELTGHFQEESGTQIDQVRRRANDFFNAGRDFVSANPLTCIGAALALGFFIGLTRRRHRTN
jgi:ElaB/YqjD/DUF883 family membrane-anchored ribosome-binding protein